MREVGKKMGKMDKISNVFIGVASAVALAFTAGCGNPSSDGSEAISTIEAAFSQSSCASDAADQTFIGGIDPAIVTPRSYGLTLPATCFKGYVVDIHDLDAMYTGPGSAIGGRIEVSYAENAITDQATCEATKLHMMVYHCVSGTNLTGGVSQQCSVLDDRHSYGTWAGGQCVLNPINFTGVSPGGWYRVAGTARSPLNSTRKIGIGTYPPINL